MLNKDEIKFFEKQGYYTTNQYSILDKNNIDIIKKSFDKYFLKYEEGVINKENTKYSEFHNIRPTFKVKNVTYGGTPLIHRYKRGYGSIDGKNNTNFLFGKRGVLGDRYFSKQLIKIIENENILNAVASILETKKDNLSFHNGSLAKVYPGCTGESKRYHIDTPGFLDNRRNLLDYEYHVVNVFIYVSDIDLVNAPMRIIPSSHSEYHKINKYVAKSFQGNEKQNFIPQAGLLFEEIINDIGLEQEVKLTGKSGKITFMHSGLLHSSTENFSNQKTREVVILNYSKRDNRNLRKLVYYNYPSQAKKFLKNVANSKLFERSFNPKITDKINDNIHKKVFSKITQTIRYSKFKTSILIAKYKFKINYKFNLIRKKNKKYINIGSGKFLNKYVSGLDFEKGITDFDFDLNSGKKLNFLDESFYGVYSSHCIEHLQIDLADFYLKEFYRILTKDGILRITVPDMSKYFEAYRKKDAKFFDWINGKGIYGEDSWLRMITRSFSEPIVDEYTDGELYKLYKQKTREDFCNFFESQFKDYPNKNKLINDFHKSWWDEKKIKKSLKDIGFRDIEIKTSESSKCKFFVGKDFNKTRVHMSLFVEAIK